MTTLQELIKDFTELSKKEGDSGFVGRSVLAILKNKGYLEKEKEQIVKAFDEGYENGACVNEGQNIYHGSNYYKLNYESVS
jgi:hypothetical protein